MAGPNLPPRPGRAGSILAWADAIHDVVRSLFPYGMDGGGVRVNRQINGTTYSADVMPGGGEATEVDPFDLTIDTTGDAPEASFVPGCGQNLAPENVLETVDVPAGELSYAFLRCATDGQGTVQTCTLMIATEAPDSPAPVKNALPRQVDVLLHLIAYTAGSNGGADTYTPYRVFYPPTNVLLTPILAFQTSVDDPQPGGPAYDNWYTWQIGGT